MRNNQERNNRSNSTTPNTLRQLRTVNSETLLRTKDDALQMLIHLSYQIKQNAGLVLMTQAQYVSNKVANLL